MRAVHQQLRAYAIHFWCLRREIPGIVRECELEYNTRTHQTNLHVHGTVIACIHTCIHTNDGYLLRRILLQAEIPSEVRSC